MSDGPENDPYQVGYRKPPEHSQFKKRVSGNPKGRPRRRKTLRDYIEVELDRKVSIQENGKSKSSLDVRLSQSCT